MARKKKTERYVYITDKYRFYIDNLSKTLECKTNGEWKTVGYFTKLEPMMKRIVQLETDNQIDYTTITINEYIEILRAENKKIHALFEVLEIA